MIIDFHTHVYPPKQQAAPSWKGKCPMTIENVLAAQERHGVDISVISNHSPYLRHAEPDLIHPSTARSTGSWPSSSTSMRVKYTRSQLRSRTAATMS